MKKKTTTPPPDLPARPRDEREIRARRDRFASAALQGILANDQAARGDIYAIAGRAVRLADLAIAELDRVQP